MRSTPPAAFEADGRRRPALQRLYLWACRRLYNEFAWSYDAVAAVVSAGRWPAWRRSAVGYLPPGGRVLELGFGTGELLLAMASSGLAIWGVEPSPAMQRLLARKLARRHPALTPPRVRAIAQSLPFRDGFFDAVLATFPAEYISDPRTAAEIARVLACDAASPAVAPPGLAPVEPGPGTQALPRRVVCGRLVLGPFAVSLANPSLARVLPLFYGAPPENLVERWLAVLSAEGLEGELVCQTMGAVNLWFVLAQKLSRVGQSAVAEERVP